MLFNSPEFIFGLLPVTFVLYFFLNKVRATTAAKVVLLSASLFFYSFWNVKYLPLLLFSIGFNYGMGLFLSRPNKQYAKLGLAFGVITNIGLLAYFKYANFFVDNINLFFDMDIHLSHIVLPLAISFFTFQQIAYLVDNYKSQTEEHSFLNYAIFVSFFPQLIAGPIVHHKHLIPQFATKKSKVINYNNILLGLFIFTIGLFKKVVIADSFAGVVNFGHENYLNLSTIDAWYVSLSYTFQLYFDFSGYADMAIGLALLFNIKLPINFNSPYKATSIQDFWRRWHITLSTFLRDYVYIPLGGSRSGPNRTYVNLILTFLLGGLWHGAGWTFVFWGLLHGMALATHRLWTNLGLRMGKWTAWFVTFNFVNITWVYFRAENLETANQILLSMFGLNGQSTDVTTNLLDSLIARIAFIVDPASVAELTQQSATIVFGAILLGFTWIVIATPNSNERFPTLRIRRKASVSGLTAAFMAFLLFLALLTNSVSSYSEFIYFNF